ncbi:MAG: hypothetical protein WAP47_00795 [Candidatus Rokuibacteriota bacterium]
MTGEHIAYYCPRVNLLKLYGPVVAEQLRRGGMRPLVVVAGRGLMTYGAKNRALAAGLFLGDMRAQLGGQVPIRMVDSVDEFLGLLREERVRAVVHVGMRLPHAVRMGVLRPSRERGVRWCALGYLQEELLQILEDGLECLDDWDVATTLSEDGVNAAARLLKERGVSDASRRLRLVPIGFVELDQVEGFDRTALRRKHGIPADQPVIYFATAARPRLRAAGLSALYLGDIHSRLRVGSLARRFWGRRYPQMDHLATYREILRSVHGFARRHGAYLIAKTREKHRDPSFVIPYVDRLFPDGAYYPFLTLELMHLADAYIGLPSGAALEAAFVGRRMTHILPYPLEVYENPAFIPMRREFYASLGGLWDAPGLAERFHSYRRVEWEAFREWAETGKLVTDVDPAVRQSVVRKVIGFDDFKASARFLDLVEASLGEERR